MNSVVAVFADGHTIKGRTVNFFPSKDVFHVRNAAAPLGENPVEVHLQELKALFFVKDLSAKPQPDKLGEARPTRPAAGRRIRVVFNDGQILVGTSTGYQPGRPGFFIEPANADTNVMRCYVVAAAAREIAAAPPE